MKEYSVDSVKALIGNAKTPEDIEKALINTPHTRDYEMDYYDVYIPRRYDATDKKPYIRVFISYSNEVKIQFWKSSACMNNMNVFYM